MKTQEQLVAEDALIRQRILSNTGGVRGVSSHADKAASLDRNTFLLNKAIVHTSIQNPVFPPTPENFHHVLPQEPLGKMWPKNLLLYVKARISALFDPTLSVKNKMRSLPVIGYCFGWLNALLRLPLTRHRHTVAIDVLRQQNQLMHEQLHSLNQRISQIEPHLNVMHGKYDEKYMEVTSRLRKLENLDIGNRLMQLEQLEVARKLKQFTQLIRINQLDQTHDDQKFTEIVQRLEAIEQGAVGLAVGKSKTQNSIEDVDQANVDLAKFYLDFEAQFRGSRAEIKRRQEVYLSYFEAILAQPVEQRKLFVDVGCGRGEWLELLSEQGIPAIGIDSNTSMVDACLQSGYAAKVGDGIAFLQQQEKSSLAGVSGFHIIEHLPFEKLIALFDAAYAALSEGGILIFETPNPENLIIGACNFYYDPTHLKPIVPDVAQFIAKQRGFRQVEIKRLHPFPDDYQMSGDSQLAQTLNKFLFSAQDYAVIARK